MLTEIFGSYPQVKVIDLLISHPYNEYTKKDMAEYAGIARGTLYEFFNKLEDYHLIKETKKEGNGQFYKADMNSPAMKAISAFQNILSNIEIEKQINIYKIDDSKETSKDQEIMDIVDHVFDKIELKESSNNKNNNKKEISEKKSLKANSLVS
ncbi:MAG: hypothetical protein Q7V10_07280 [Methanobacteriaceae archaeon]|jgi:Fe2+ or Zn2+ uptake regulation protein|nr:hypothetical protein [Methanobacteriaceae archaeon]MDO9626850.1 hypothetical protein [Methanobacteriaceae archaeon]